MGITRPLRGMRKKRSQLDRKKKPRRNFAAQKGRACLATKKKAGTFELKVEVRCNAWEVGKKGDASNAYF